VALTSQVLYTTSNTITITLASLADDAYAVSSTIDNSSTKFVSADIQVEIRTGTGTAAGKNIVTLFVLRSVDGGTDFDLTANENAEIVGVFNANADSTDFRFSVDTTRMGLLSSHWRLAVKNESGATFDSTASNFSARYTGRTFEIV